MAKTLSTLNEKPLTEGHPLYDAAARAELERRRARIAKSRSSSDVERWKEGFEYIAIRDNKLYRQDGYRSMSKWIAHHELRSRSVVAKLMAFAARYSLADVRDFTKERLDLATEYVALTRTDADEAFLPSKLVVQVPLKPKGYASVALRNCAPWELELAIAHQVELAEKRQVAALADEDVEFLAELTNVVQDELGPLAEIRMQPAESGLADDTVVEVRVRRADLHSVIQRLLRQVESSRPPRLKGGRQG